MNKALKSLLGFLHGWNAALDDKSLAFVLKDQDGKSWHGGGSPSPDGFGYKCSPGGIIVEEIDGMDIKDLRFTWLQFVKWVRKQMDETKGETEMTNSIEKKETFADPRALHAIEVRIAMHVQEARRNCLEVGLCLCEAKDAGLVPHGQWESWVMANTGLSDRQAQRLMKAAREVPEGSTLAKLDLSKITEILALPAAEREDMAERAVNESMTVKQLRDAIDRERKRSDAMIEKYNNVTLVSKRKDAEISRLHQTIDETQAHYEAMQKATEQNHKRELGALRLQLQEALAAPAIGPEAQRRIDQLTAELADAEAYAEEQARLRQEAQQELLNASMQHGGEDPDQLRFGCRDLEAAVRVFLGEVGVMMYMDTELATLNDMDKRAVRKQLSMIEDWTQRVRQQLDARVIIAE